jgi:LPS sulfotransferase NodH
MADVPTPVPERADSYLICATPRTGSSLLCGLLESTGVAGHPESYFRQPDEPAWAARWGIVSQPGGTFRYADYLHAARAAGTTENGVFGARIMWGTLDELVAKLAEVYPGRTGSDAELLRRAFDRTRYLYLRRSDVIAQAVSWLRAEQTGIWFEQLLEPAGTAGRGSRYDFDHVHKLVRLIGEHHSAWQEWFARSGIQPYRIVYEELAADPVGVVRGVLDFLWLTLPAGRQIAVRHRQLADDVSAQWIRRYRAEARES